MVVKGKKWVIVITIVVGNYKTYLSKVDFAHLTPYYQGKNVIVIRK